MYATTYSAKLKILDFSNKSEQQVFPFGHPYKALNSGVPITWSIKSKIQKKNQVQF